MAWTRAHYAEFVRAWGIVVRHRPVKPVRTAAFAVSRAACLAHPDTFTPSRINPDFDYRTCFHDVVNTAEEDTAFAYEESRLDGQQAGFVTALEHTEGRRQDAARLLGWGRNTLTRKIKELKMEVEGTNPEEEV